MECRMRRNVLHSGDIFPLALLHHVHNCFRFTKVTYKITQYVCQCFPRDDIEKEEAGNNKKQREWSKEEKCPILVYLTHAAPRMQQQYWLVDPRKAACLHVSIRRPEQQPSSGSPLQGQVRQLRGFTMCAHRSLVIPSSRDKTNYPEFVEWIVAPFWRTPRSPLNRLQRLIPRELTQMRVQCIDYRVCVRQCRWWDTNYNGFLSLLCLQYLFSIVGSYPDMLMGRWGFEKTLV